MTRTGTLINTGGAKCEYQSGQIKLSNAWKISSLSTSSLRGGLRVTKEGLLSDVNSRTPAATGKETTEGSGMGERTGASQAGQEGPAALRLCNLVAPGTGDAQRAVQAGSRKGTDWKGTRAVGGDLFQTITAGRIVPSRQRAGTGIPSEMGGLKSILPGSGQ